jgi:hypothetical protein
VFILNFRTFLVASAAAAAATAAGLRLRNCDRHLSAAYFVSIQAFDCGFSLSLRFHLYESESARSSSFSILRYAAGYDRSEFREQLLQFIIRDTVREIANE